MKPYIENGRVWFDRKTYEILMREDDCEWCQDIQGALSYDTTHKHLFHISLKYIQNQNYVEHLKQIIGNFKGNSREKVTFT